MPIAIGWINKRGLEGTLAMLDGVPSAMVMARRQVALKVAAYFLVELQANLYGQTLNLAPLAPGYLEEKKRLGRDPRILLATHQLAAQLKVFLVGRDTYVAGLQGSTRVPGTNLTFVQLMAVLELGSPSRHLAARPIFKLTLLANEVAMRQVAATEFGRIWRTHVRAHLP